MIWMMIFMVLPIVALGYVGWHFWLLLPLAGVWKTAVIAIGAACFLLLFLDLGRKLDSMPLSVAQWLYEIGTSSVIVLMYMVMIFLVADIGRLIHIVPRHLVCHSWTGTLILATIIISLFTYGNLHYRHKYRQAVSLTTGKALPRSYRFVMASDLHLGYHNPRKELARWVDMFNAENADAIFIAGDIIDVSLRPLIEEDMAAEFRRLNAPVYACLGNHEYYSGQPEAIKFYQAAGIHLLRDEAAVIDSTIVVVGRDDRANMRRKPLGRLAGSVDKSKYMILLDHQPYNLEQAEREGFDLQLSGHTHHGQVWPASWITEAIYECAWGKHQRGNTHYYVSSGLGIWGGKFRIGTRSEYAVITVGN